MVRPRLIPIARAEGVRQELTRHELGVLVVLQRIRLAHLRQLQRLVAVEGTPQARARKAQRLMTKLTTLGVVTRFSRRIGGVRAGSSGFIYGLSELGYAVLAAGNLDADTKRRQVWESKPYFQDHMLAVTELYVQLVEGHRLGRGELLAYDAEPTNWRHFTGSGGELVQVKPDAYVRLGAAALEYSSFVEVDLSTETLPTILKKSQRYVDYWRSGMEQQRRGVFPRVVWLVKDRRRAQRISSVLGKLATEAQVLFRVGLLRDGPRLLSGGQTEQTGAAP